MQLLYVDNYTPFEWFAFEKMGPHKRLYDLVIVKTEVPIQKPSILSLATR